MASLNQDAKGWRVQVVVDGERRTIRLGARVKARDAQRFAGNVETLATNHAISAGPDEALALWLAKLPDRTHERLAAIGLVAPRVKAEVVTLGGLLDRFVASKTAKPATMAVYRRVRASLEEHFGTECPIETIGRERVEGWFKSLADAEYAVATQAKLCHIAKAVFRKAVRWGLLVANPCDDLRPGPQSNPRRAAYIPLADLDRIIDACPSHDWRCIFGLARLAGLRCPSEVVELRWGDVDFDTNRMTVTSPKTERHGADHAVRTVPIVPRLHRLFMAAFDAAPEGEVYVVSRLRHADTNLRTQAHRILRKAGIQPPPKLFVNLRASCATDWAQAHPGHVAARWLGHGSLVAFKHYWQTRPEDFDKATGGGTEPSEKPVQGSGETGIIPPVAHPVAQSCSEPASTDPQHQPPNAVFQALTGGDGSVQVGKWAQQDSNL